MSKKGKKGIVLAAPCMATLSFQVLTLPKPKDGSYKKLCEFRSGTMYSLEVRFYVSGT